MVSLQSMLNKARQKGLLDLENSRRLLISKLPHTHPKQLLVLSLPQFYLSDRFSHFVYKNQVEKLRRRGIFKLKRIVLRAAVVYERVELDN